MNTTQTNPTQPTRTEDGAVVRAAVARLGEPRGTAGWFCGSVADWCEAYFERGAVRTIQPHSRNRTKHGARYWLIWER